VCDVRSSDRESTLFYHEALNRQVIDVMVFDVSGAAHFDQSPCAIWFFQQDVRANKNIEGNKGRAVEDPVTPLHSLRC
jgi:hypothetical protein